MTQKTGGGTMAIARHGSPDPSPEPEDLIKFDRSFVNGKSLSTVRQI
jgi:hypothetical protein